MATRVYDEESITLQDGREVVLRPLPIARLRRFMAAWGKFAEAENDDEGFTVFINCCGVSLENNYKGEFDSLKASTEEKQEDPDAVLSSEYREYLEETLELESIYKILDVCGGIKLNDPKLQEMAESLLNQTETDPNLNQE